jgi:hypothetical protein
VVTHARATGLSGCASVRTVNAGVGYVWSAKLVNDPIEALVLVRGATNQIRKRKWNAADVKNLLPVLLSRACL